MDEQPVAGRIPVSLWPLARLYLKLGTIAFGGPAAHIAMMEEEVVRRRRWLTSAQFLDLLGAANLIPGPSSTELAIYIGYWRAGVPGLLVAGSCFILPAALMVTAIAWAYMRFGGLPVSVGLLYGIKPIVIAIVAQALWRLGRTAVKTRFLAVIGVAAAVLSALGVAPVEVLFGAGALVAVVRWAVKSRKPRGTTMSLTPLLSASHPTTSAATAATIVAGGSTAVGLGPLFWVFLKIGSVVFGSGYVLLAFLNADLVTERHWLTERQLLDAVAVGQVTPGPVFTTATFIGYLLAGPAGAAVATVGIFLPAFILVLLTGPMIRQLRKSAVAGAFLDGLNVASAALMAVVTWQLGHAALVDATTILIAGVGAILLVLGVASPWLVGIAAVVGIVMNR